MVCVRESAVVVHSGLERSGCFGTFQCLSISHRTVTVREFWDSTFAAPRAALACAAIAATLNVASYAGLGMSFAGGAFAIVHLVIVALGFALFVRIAQHHVLAIRAADVRPETTARPARLVWATVAALAYVLVLSIGLFAASGEGNAEFRGGREVWVVRDSVVRVLKPGSVAVFDARSLRLFSAAWLFFALMIALTWHRIEEKIRGYRAALHRRGA